MDIDQVPTEDPDFWKSDSYRRTVRSKLEELLKRSKVDTIDHAVELEKKLFAAAQLDTSPKKTYQQKLNKVISAINQKFKEQQQQLKQQELDPRGQLMQQDAAMPVACQKLRQLLVTLRGQESPVQQQQVLEKAKLDPLIYSAFIKQREEQIAVKLTAIQQDESDDEGDQELEQLFGSLDLNNLL